MFYKKIIENIRKELEFYIINGNIKSLVLGVSGGIDSALVAALAKPVCDKLNIPLIGRSLPITTNNPDEIERAALIGKVYCTDFKQENLGEIFNSFSIINPFNEDAEENPKNWKIRNGNIKARLRMTYLYNLAALNNGLVLSTDNWTEYLLGFWTLHGDVGDYGMIQELWKSEVYDIAEWIANNESGFIDEAMALTLCVEAMATDGLGINGLGDLGQIFPEWKGNSRDGYTKVDGILQIWKKLDILGPKQRTIIIEKLKDSPIIKRHIASEFKRNNPINIDRDIITHK